MVQCHYDIYPLAIIGSCGGVLIVYAISKFIALCSLFLSNLLRFIGSISIVILCFHLVEMRLDIYHRLHLPDILSLQLIMRLLVPIIISLLCVKIKVIRNIFQIKYEKV